MGRPTTDIGVLRARQITRIYARLLMDHATGCWVWQGATDKGYGVARWGHGRGRVHRIVYEQELGPITEGLTLDHLCRNRACANPIHLEPVGNVTNVMRGESPFAKRARQTHCKHGHEFTSQNTLVRPNGTRACRRCKADAEARRRSRSHG